MKLLTALGNQHIQDSLKKSYPEIEFLLPDFTYQEGIIESLKSTSTNTLVISLDIEGDLDRYSFIQTIRDINDSVKIILIIKSEDKDYLNWLVSKGVYDVFIDGKCTFQDIYECLIKEQKVIIKKEIQKEYIEKEKIITKEKVIKEIVSVSFKKLILTVWGNAEFACEFAYTIAKVTNFKVLLADLDLVSPKADMYLNLSNKLDEIARDPPMYFGFSAIIEALEKGKLTFTLFEQACLKRKELQNLYVLMDADAVGNFDKYKDNNISSFIDCLYHDFDIVILIIGRSVFDPFTTTALIKSDYNVISIPASADALREFESSFLYMNVKFNVPIDKSRFVAFEYKKGIHYPVSYLKDIFTQNGFLGVLSYTRERELFRNLNSFYAKWAFKKTPEEYAAILTKFNIVSKKTFTYKIINCFMKKAKRFFKHICKTKTEAIDNE